MNKFLSIRLVTAVSFAFLAACSTPEYSKRATEPEGPFSTRARNAMATENPEGLLRVGEGFERSGNMQAAQNIYGQAMAAAPDMIEAQVAFARVSYGLGQAERALAMLSALLVQYPENDQVRAELTAVYIREGDFAAAEKLMRATLEKRDASASHLNLGGRIAQVAGDGERARELFERALRKAPQSTEVLENIALSFALEGEFPTAVGILQSVMDRPAGLIRGKIALATVYALSGQLDAAMMLARGAMPMEEANERKVFYQLLPRLEGKERAMAVMFDQVPTDAIERLSGRASN